MPTALRNLPPLRALRVLEALWQHGSVSAAARALNVSYPAISHQIRTLEDHSDVQLFRRDGRRTVLTAAGASLARVVHEGFVAMVHEMDLLSLRESAPVTIVASPQIASGWLMPRIAQFLDRHESWSIHLTLVQNDVPVANDPDLLTLFDMDGNVPERGVPLVSGRAVPVAAPRYLERHPIRRDSDIITANRYQDEDMRMWDLWFDAAQLEAPAKDASRLFLGGSTMARDIALYGEGVALCREELIQPELTSGRLVKLSDTAIDEASRYFVVKGPQDREKPDLDVLIDFLSISARWSVAKTN